MRIGLHGLAGVAPWRSLVAALGEGAEVAVLEGAGGARCDAIVVCGGLADGNGERETAAVLAFARGGGAVLGLGAGFQALCVLGLLPGRVTASSDDEGETARAHVRVEGRATPFTSAIPAGRVMSLGGSPGVGLRYEIGEPADLEVRGQVIFRYCDAAGGPLSPSLSPPSGERENEGQAQTRAGRGRARANGLSQLRLSSVPLIPPRLRARAIAGICGEAGNVVGVLTAASAIDAIGAQLLGSLRMHLRSK
jgi:hypothetical protein